MKRALVAGLGLAFSAGGALASPPQTAPIDQAFRDDVNCAVVYMVVAAKGEEAAAALGFYYFIGRMEGRSPDVDWRPHVLAAAARADQALLDANGKRCGDLLTENGRQMGGIDDQISRWSAGEGPMGAALQALRRREAGS